MQILAQVAAVAPADPGVPFAWAAAVVGGLVAALVAMWRIGEVRAAREIAGKDATIAAKDAHIARLETRVDEARARELDTLRSTLAATRDLADHTIAVSRVTEALEDFTNTNGSDASPQTRRRS